MYLQRNRDMNAMLERSGHCAQCPARIFWHASLAKPEQPAVPLSAGRLPMGRKRLLHEGDESPRHLPHDSSSR